MTKIFFSIVCLLIVCSIGVFSQNKDRKTNSITNSSSKDCRVFLNGKLLNNPQPIYPTEAKTAGIAGKVEVAVEIDESGKVTTIENVNGDERLKKAASEAALHAKFSPTLCDGIPAKTVGIITFNFSKIALTNEYFKPTKLEELTDVTAEKEYYEAILFLTENYQIAFCYADQKFHGEMPLTKGDFVHFLRQTLEMLDARAEVAKLNPQSILLYQPYNPNSLKEIEFNPKSPFADSLKILSQKYIIILAEKDGNFEGNISMTKGEIVETWRSIFGDEAIPINFLSEKNRDKEMSRGDFAIYLKEALDVLTYKVLP